MDLIGYTRGTAAAPKLDQSAIVEVKPRFHSETRFLFNKASHVTAGSGAATYSFRNPPHFMPLDGLLVSIAQQYVCNRSARDSSLHESSRLVGLATSFCLLPPFSVFLCGEDVEPSLPAFWAKDASLCTERGASCAVAARRGPAFRVRLRPLGPAAAEGSFGSVVPGTETPSSWSRLSWRSTR